MVLNRTYKSVKGLMVAAIAVLLISCNASEKVLATEVVMYKDPNCGCCGDWAKHLRNEGFTVIEKNSDDMAQVKRDHGISPQLASCHTATVGSYVIEGHVPAGDIKRLLKEKPEVAGLSAPGMPQKSPGMQAEGLPPEGYDVLSFDKSGKSAVFSHY
ncbi:hypothetical protein Ga0123462_0082 [Mariprofundus ferrinatatus]|uniref:Metal-binding protein n=1 Tax=Mariprofundus ferrinatatus TaxID=1921087 RepID=A0A2K8L537_9PROT|nr:DUF411 domain-containing protein [Mariprofundus ferrinatatus]ATX80961.1 hypothetical protein Ga0123462_0082 [Mariprofundus ferrinatatus]